MDFRAGVSTDTRTIARGDAFFALSGEHFDGHDFIGAALEKGAASIVYTDEAKAAPFRQAKAEWIRVPDTLAAYGDYARQKRLAAAARVAAVTGSSGKTTVKEMLAHVLSARFTVHKNHGTENNLVGVPKTIFALEPGHTAMVLELGTNLPGEIARLSEIASPDIAAITRVGESHLQGLGSIEGVRKEKLSIARGLKPGASLWVNGDDPMLREAAIPGIRMRRAAIEDPAADLRGENVREDGEGISFRADGTEFRLRCLGRHNVVNALLAAGIAREWGMGGAEIARALAVFEPVRGRLQARRLEGLMFLDDTYNANPVSFEAALRALAAFPIAGKRFAVAGDMLELGPQAELLHRRIGRLAAELKIDFWIAAGEGMRAAADEAVRAGLDASCVRICRDAGEAGQALRGLLKPADAALVKGSRGMKMERVFECFTPSFTR